MAACSAGRLPGVFKLKMLQVIPPCWGGTCITRGCVRSICHTSNGISRHSGATLTCAEFPEGVITPKCVDFPADDHRSAFDRVADGREYPFDRPGLEIWPTVDVAFADEPQMLQYSVG